MKMLIVDDSTVMQRKIQRSITLEQVTDFLTASNGMEAVEIFRQELPELVTMDLTMPKWMVLNASSIWSRSNLMY
jgi:two-component system chemotaxis response regulator CheY